MLSSVGCTRCQKLGRQQPSLKRSEEKERLMARKRTYWKCVEAGAEVEQDGDIPVPCRFFFRELDGCSGMSNSEMTSASNDDISVFLVFLTDARFLPGCDKFLIFQV